MGLLDELKQQAQSAAANEKDAKAQLRSNLEAIDAALRAVFAYLDELVEQLRVIKPTNAHTFKAWSAGEWTNLAFENAAVNLRQTSIENVDWYSLIEFGINWRAPRPLKVSFGSQVEAQFLKDRLWHLGCRLEEKITKTAEERFQRSAITVEPMLPTRLRFEAQIETAKIQLTVRNLDQLGEDVLLLDPAECNPALCEELAKTLLGRPSQINALLKR
ncbi:hypothetical protein IGB42_04105 [Andreprevotia sp. IGB-42]|uniref:hypothetical protein n=1 Tax=Andreprevotia sp. IGB-42 TaxID=2497473 RepID=UPI00135986FF|nr:hypothetical protein [Andreprevotia sp. IGB-42]KAF0811407.1 hypothetical protein IGB42_04105 [Andreprevotia sp. IGB-42]